MVKRDNVTHCQAPDCGVEVRRASDPKRDGTRRYSGNGLCSTCASRERTGARPKTEVPPFCDRCDRPQRVRSAPADGVTVPYHGRGLCQWCYDTTTRRELRLEAAWVAALGIDTKEQKMCDKTRRNSAEQVKETGILVMVCVLPDGHGGKHLDANDSEW